MQLVPNPTTTDLTALDDDAIEAYFERAGLDVRVVSHCDDALCPRCLRERPAKAA